jgi:LysM repeat protein
MFDRLSLADGRATPARVRDRSVPWVVALVFGFGLGLLPHHAAGAGQCKKGQRAVSHKIARGETLSNIASRYGVTVSAVEATNPKLDPRALQIGQRVLVCEGTKRSSSKSSSSKKRCGRNGRIVEHEVAKGETLSAIARSYNVSEKSVLARNSGLQDNPNKIRSGQSLLVCVDASRAVNAKSCGYRTPLHRHAIVPGDYIAEIASRYGVRRKDILKLNQKLAKNPNYLRPGNELLVCPDIPPRYRTEIEHTVKSGETFGGIAKRYDVTRRQLSRFQRGKLDDPSKLRTGQRLRVWVDAGLVPGFGAYGDEDGVLQVGVLLPKGYGYTTKPSSLRWGTPRAVRLIQTALGKYWSQNRGGPKIHVGDISRKGGGPFPPHKSHQTGLDVDVGYVLKGPLKDERRFRKATEGVLDVKRSWTLLKSFLDTGRVRYIFADYSVQRRLYEHAKKRGVSEDTLDELFQYPRGKGRARGIVRHWKGHLDHFHVRFKG